MNIRMKRRALLWRGENSYAGLGIHVLAACPPGLWANLRYFFPDYGSCFVTVAVVIGLLYGDVLQLWINVSNS